MENKKAQLERTAFQPDNGGADEASTFLPVHCTGLSNRCAYPNHCKTSVMNAAKKDELVQRLGQYEDTGLRPSTRIKEE